MYGNMYGNVYGKPWYPVVTRSIKVQQISQGQIDNFKWI